MELFGTNIFGFRKREAAPAPIASTPGVPKTTDPNDASNQAKVGGGSFEERIVYVDQPRVALTVSPVYRAVKLIMDTMGVMPVQYRKRDFEKGNFYIDMRGLGKRINYLLQVEPNPVMTASDMWKLVTYNQLMRGNGCVYIERDEFGFPYRLWFIKSGEYNLMTGTYNFIQYLTEDGYVERVNVSSDDVMHFANTYRYDNGFWGMPTLEAARGDLSLIKTLKAQSLETAAKGGRMKLIIGEDTSKTVSPIAAGLFDKAEMEKYADEVNQRIYQKDVIALRALDKVQNISMSAAEMQAAENLGLSYDDCARYFGVPRPLLMLDTNSHYNDYSNATMEFHTRTILPEKTDREREIFRKLIGFKDYGVRDIHICEDPLMVMDPERRAKVAQLKMQSGLCTVNEARQEFDMPSVNNGDVPLASANLMTLDALIAKSDAATQLKPGNYTVGEPAKEGEETA